MTKEVSTRPGLLGIPASSTTNYTYDGNGNRTREQTGASVTDYTYTADDRVASIDQGLREVEYEYDGLGRALVESVSSLLILGSETEQVWDGMVVVAQSSGSGGTSLVRDVLGDVALQASPGLLGTTDTRWGLTDRLGSTVGQAQGSKVGQLASYSDYGVPMFDTLGWNSETGYTGELGDATAGVWNFYARSYDPMSASWLSADPYRGTLDDPQTLGRYGYVTGNPTTHTDAYGYAVTNRMLHDGEFRPVKTKNKNLYGSILTAPNLARPNSPQGASDISDRHGLGDLATELACQVGRQYAPYGGPCNAAEAVASNREISKSLSNLASFSEILFAVCMADFANPACGGFKSTSAIAAVGARSLAVQGATFAQRTASPIFSAGGPLRGQTIESVASALKSGSMTAADVPIEVIVRDGHVLILNTRSALALEQSGVPRTAWTILDMSGDAAAEARLTNQLANNGLDSAGIAEVRITG